jgi:hypothetical protein
MVPPLDAQVGGDGDVERAGALLEPLGTLGPGDGRDVAAPRVHRRCPGLVTLRRPAEVLTAFLDRLDAHVPGGRVIHAVVDNLNNH